MNLGPRHWGLAVLAATLIHATAGISWILPADDGAEMTSDSGIEVMLGDDGAANQEEPSAEVEPDPQAESNPVATPEPVPTPVPPVPTPRPTPVKPQPQPKPKQAPAPQSGPEAPSPSDMLSTAAEAAPVAQAPPPPAPPRKSGGGLAGGAATAQKKNYYGELAAHLARHQRYPMEARRRKITGIVSVRFRIGSQGRVLESAIKKSSGNRLLDDEATAMLRRAQPLPPIPKELGADTISISLPIEFSLRRK